MTQANREAAAVSGQRCPGCGEAGQAAPCVFCGQPQDPACGYGTAYEPPGPDSPGQWHCLECGAVTADDPVGPPHLTGAVNEG